MSTIVTDPGTLFANIPGILGFYPTDSLVLMCFAPNPEGRLSLGPSLRFDIGSADHLTGALQDLDDYTHLFALVVSSDPIEVTRAVAHVESAVEATNPDALIGCWVTSAVATGETLTAALSVGEPEWEVCSIGDVSAAPATLSALAKGHLIEASREDAVGRFNRNHSPLEPDVAQTITAQAMRRAAAALEAARGGDATTVRDLSEQFHGLLVHLGEADSSADALMGNLTALTLGSAVLSETHIRDFVVLDVLAVPRAAMELMTAIARTTSEDVIRANALCMYAIAAWKTQTSGQGELALKVSASEFEDHNLTALLSSACDQPLADHLLEAVELGAATVRKMITQV